MGGIGTKHNYNMPPNIQKSDPEKTFFEKEENEIYFFKNILKSPFIYTYKKNAHIAIFILF